MNKFRHQLAVGLFLISGITLNAQNVNKIDNPQMLYNGAKNNITIPDVDGFVALKCDFHLHTMFSDGLVWPTIRVTEAIKNGLDAIAITDHIEYRPYKKHTTGDLNISYDIAKAEADRQGIILVKGIEITRDKKIGGHLNALFIQDANPIANQDIEIQIDQANKQGAYIIWNHPGWAIDSCIMFEANKRWIDQKKVQAVEVFNEKEYYPRATTWVRDMQLAPMACSDAHQPIELLYANDVRRPITIVFAKDKSLESLREALFDKRTVAWFNNELAGEATILEKLFRASVAVEKNTDRCVFTNNSDLVFKVKFANKITLLTPKTTVVVSIPKNADSRQRNQLELINLHTSESTNLIISI